SLYVSGILTTGSLMPTWCTWWTGDMLGVLLIAPLLLTWATRRSVRLQAAGAGETILVVGSLVLVASIVFGEFLGPFDKSSIAYLVFPPLIWTALRFGPRGAAT